ncbi:MAG TPA: MerR family transcriptional regulator [Gammaproteobacteria bacterium]|nr:MerR family transcriptional regulator [Gammaproteobacteria bacterium]
MFTVSELATRASVTPDTVRHYVQIGLLQPRRNPDNGYKLFETADIHRLLFVRQAKSLGFTLNEIREILGHAQQGESPCPRVREIIHRRITENRRHLDELMTLQQRMESALVSWEAMPDGMPSGESVCHLIEEVMVPARSR